MKVIEATTTRETTIYITALDRQRLEKLIELVGERSRVTNQEYVRRLEQELDRAETVAPAEVPADVITMRSKVPCAIWTPARRWSTRSSSRRRRISTRARFRCSRPSGRRCSDTASGAASSGKSPRDEGL